MLVKEFDSEIGRIISHKGSMKFSISLVFGTTICGYHEGKLITILDGSKKLLPMSVVVDGELKGENYSLGDELTMAKRDDADLVIRDDTRSINLRIPSSREQSLISNQYGQILSALRSLSPDFKGMLPVLATADMLHKRLEHSGIEEKMYDLVANRTKVLLSDLIADREIAAENIVGYGIGLTPSADDFLLGIAGIFDRYGEFHRKGILAEYIEKHLHTTTEVSGWMLRYGIREMLYPSFLIDYLENQYPGKLRIDDFIKHGSSSGIDLLCGLLCGLYVLMESKD